MPALILASASPRRRDLLALVNGAFTVLAPDLDETPLPDELPAPYVERLALAKADAVLPTTGAAVVIAADTTIDLDGAIVGKADGPEDAAVMLRRLSGRSHVVHTGLAVVSTGPNGSSSASTVVSTTVRFAAIDEATLAWYLATDEWRGKAGAYALQGAGGLLVERIGGSVSGVIGLPLAELVTLCETVGFALLDRSTHRGTDADR